MVLSKIVNSRFFRSLSLVMVATTAYVPSAIGFNALFGSLQDALQQEERMPNGHYTTTPGEPYLGKHPGRDIGRGFWSKEALANAALSSVDAIASIDPLEYSGGHVVSVAPAPGPPLPWEGNVPWQGRTRILDHSILNTANGNRLFKLNLVSWKSRGLNVDFTIYHNSQTNYVDELAYGWTCTTDIYINNLTSTPIVHWADGTSIPYSGSGPTFTPPPGFYDQLVENTGGTWTITRKNGVKYLFNTAGFCTAMQDLDGNQVTFTLNSANYCTKITDPTGKYLTINLNSSNQVTSIVDPASRQWSFTIDSNGDLAKIWWPALSGILYTDAFTYSGHMIATHTDKRFQGWNAAYNSDGSVSNASDPLLHSLYIDYSSGSTTIHDPLGHTSVDYYSSGVLSSRKDGSGYSKSFTSRDSNFNVLTYVDKDSHSWNSTYDSKGNTLTLTDPLSHLKTWTYNSLCEILSETDALSNVVTNTYSSSGHLLTVVDPLSHTIQTDTFDSYGEIQTLKDALNNCWQLIYDVNGNCTSLQDPMLNVSLISYDSLNRPTSIKDPLGHTETAARDPWGRTFCITHSDSTVASIASDNEDDVVSQTDENLHMVSYVYDAAQRLTSSTNARSDTETYGYDNANNRTFVTDGKGHIRNYTYTPRGEIATLTLADGAEEQWAYDGNGNTTAYVNPISQTIIHVFDNANRESGINYPSGTNTSFTFDNADRQVSMVDATGTTSWGYDFASRLTSLNTPQGNMTYTYDNAGKRLTLVEGTGTTTYTFDADSRLTSIQNPYSETTSLNYDNDGRLTKKTLSSGAYDSIGYDNRNRITSLSHLNSSGSVLSSETYAYDNAWNMTSKTVDTLTTNYTFDVVDQLLTESRTGYSSTYTYDANGNRASQVLNGATYAYSYDSGDKLNSVSSGGSAVKSYTYDGAGRTHTVTSGAGTTTLNYDYEDRLTGIAYPGSATNSFIYNGLDTRVSKVDSSGTSTFKRDGTNVTDPVLSDGTIAFTPGVSEHRAGVTTFDHDDFLGTFTRQTNASQTTTATRVFDAFGNLEATTGTPQGSFGFVGGQGYQSDSDSGLQLIGHRYYDPSTGRFITRDPAKDGRNWYTYCRNNPLIYTDRTGYQQVHGNTLNSAKATLYGKYDAQGNFKKYGITKDISTRYSKTELNRGYLEPIAEGERQDMSMLERYLVERDGGDENNEPWSLKNKSRAELQAEMDKLEVDSEVRALEGEIYEVAEIGCEVVEVGVVITATAVCL